MKLFKSNKSKSYSTKKNAQTTNNPTDPPPQEHKSLLSISPSESGILSINNSKTKNILPQSNLPDAFSLNQAQSDHKSMEDPPLLRPQSAFDHIPNKHADDDEPENSFVSAQGINLIEKKSTYVEGPNTGILPMRSQSKHESQKIATESEVMKSLTEIGPYDVELTEKDPEKSSKLPTMKLDLNPFSEKRRPKESFHERKMSKDPSSSSRAPLMMETENMKSPDILDFDKSKQVSETYPLTGLLESPPLEGGILETKSIPIMQDASKLQAPDRTIRDKKALSVSFVEPKEEPSAAANLKRAASEAPSRPMIKNGDDVDIDPSPMSAMEAPNKTKGKKISFLSRKKKQQGEIPKKKPWKVPVLLWIVIYIVLVYIGIPFAMFFGAYGYKDDSIRAILNFGLLGLFQGIVQVLLLHQLIDVPILNKIKEIEGKHRGLLNPSKYLVINKIHALGILAISIGLQIAAGVTIKDLEKDVTGTAILVSCICTTAIKAAIWFVLIWIKSPRALKNERKILDAELKEIGEIRKDFMADLYDTRKKMEIKSINHNIVPNGVPQILSTAYLGLSSSVVHNVDVDARKLLHKVYDFSAEFKRIRFSSVKTFMILSLSMAQILSMIHIIRKVEEIDSVAPSLLMVIVLFVVGTIFGVMDLFRSATKPELNTMKLVSLIVTSASYRFLFIALSSRSKMIGAAIIKLVYKVLLYYFAALFSERIFKKFKRDKKKGILVDLYESLQEKEASHVRRPVYIFLKSTLLLEVDLFFAVVSLYLTKGAQHFLNTTDLAFGLRPEIEYNFYLALVLIEMGVHIVFGLLFALMTHKILKRRAKTVTISLWQEFMKSMKENRWVIVGFKGLLLFILLFTFFNEI